METTRSEPQATAAVATAALAGSSALVLGVGDAVGFTSERAETLFTTASILGWTLLVWAAVLGGLSVVQLVRRLASRSGTSRSEVVWIIAGAAIIVGVIATHPVVGTGSGTG